MKFEYLVSIVGGDHASLNSLGLLGWELVSVVYYTPSTQMYAYYKRPLPVS